MSGNRSALNYSEIVARQDAQVAKQAKEQIEYNERMQMARGRQPAQAKTAQELEKALNFVAVAGTRKVRATDDHCMLREKWALMTDGQISAGHPIEEDINCCPHLGQLRAAIKKCGKTLAVTLLSSGRLSLKGEKLRALVPCLTFEEMPDIDPDIPGGPVDDTLKAAFEVCSAIADENADDVLSASLLLEPQFCTATDHKHILQYWHGHNLPPGGLVIPKIFAQAVCKQKDLRIVSLGWEPGRSITIHFENGAWIKTLLYVDQWPVESIYSVLNRPTNNLTDVPEDLFKGAEAIIEFNENGYVYFVNDGIQSHMSAEQGAQYEVKGLIEGKCLNGKSFVRLRPFMDKMDYQTSEYQISFFGCDGKARGCFTTYNFETGE